MLLTSFAKSCRRRAAAPASSTREEEEADRRREEDEGDEAVEVVVRNGDANHAGEKRRRHTIHQKMEGNILLVSEPCRGEEE